MFIGRYYHHLEESGRVTLPKNFRELCHNWVVTRGIDGGLLLLPQEQFQQQLSQIANKSFTKQSNRDLVRLLANDAKNLEIDKLGRVQLPEYLIQFAKLIKELVVVGSFQWVEIWNATVYHSHLDSIESHSISIAENISNHD